MHFCIDGLLLDILQWCLLPALAQAQRPLCHVPDASFFPSPFQLKLLQTAYHFAFSRLEYVIMTMFTSRYSSFLYGNT